MRICELRPAVKSGWWKLRMDDGSELSLSEEIVASFSLYAGKELEEDTLAAVRRAAGESAAKEKALSLLARRPYGKRELERRLTGGGFSAEAAEAAASRLEELELLDDGEYAKALARSYAEKGYGEGRIRRELSIRGVPRMFWAAALEELGDPQDAIERFLIKKLPGSDPDAGQLRRAYEALLRRGFSSRDIMQALRRRGTEYLEE